MCTNETVNNRETTLLIPSLSHGEIGAKTSQPTESILQSSKEFGSHNILAHTNDSSMCISPDFFNH